MGVKKKNQIETNAPKNKELSVQTSDVENDYQETFPGDSVEEHKRIESANKQLGADEIKQQFNNL
ncbi:hypothetical protein [Salinibacillus xinjiangensis]|uniref:DUF4025 domain-containing protein n=1 Tax=Salinibacillus xinjiangensis TaxID=1229268 RepID=A0A6G1X4H3_9BACI|nr:hypothetical protein [Salinibacillus xinjiangensis]MRG85805.1 hypothetical protein [Salinibacillus xinjiangensis]